MLNSSSKSQEKYLLIDSMVKLIEYNIKINNKVISIKTVLPELKFSILFLMKIFSNY